MTILPKKKSSKDKNDETGSDHNSKSSLGHSVHAHTSHSRVGRARNSPPRWPSHGYREEKRTQHDPGPSYETVDAPSCQKRRHRTSPHHHVRKQRSSAAVTVPYEQTLDTFNFVEQNEELQRDNEIDVSGYNSGDEYVPPPINAEEEEEQEKSFEMDLKNKKGLVIKRMEEDGACLFRAVADQVYGDQEMHNVTRKHCMDYMLKNRDFFAQYVTEEFESYVERKRLDHVHGNHIEMQALSEMYNRTLEVFQCRNGIEPIKLFQTSQKTENEPIRLSYHKNVHYNSVVDPCRATIGVGLGLPQFKPGLADRNLMNDAIKRSEEFEIEQAMLEDKVRATDWEATNEAIEEQVARESYLQWLRENEKRGSCDSSVSTQTASATCSSATAAESTGDVWWEAECRPSRSSPRGHSQPNSPNRPEPSDCMELSACAAGPSQSDIMTSVAEEACARTRSPPPLYSTVASQASLVDALPASVYGFANTDWEEQSILAQVIAESQREYLDSLRKNVANTDEAGPS